jgi:hypothetical protein
MNKIQFANARYEAINRLVAVGAVLEVVVDPLGSTFSNLVWDLYRLTKREEGETLENLLSAARFLRWRLMTHPQPIDLNGPIREVSNALVSEIVRIRGSLATDGEVLLNSLENSVKAVATSDPPIGSVILDMLTRSADEREIVVVAVNAAAARGIEMWLGDRSVSVRNQGDLSRERKIWNTEIAVGPPKIFQSGLLTAPSAPSVTFVFPEWFRDGTVPRSPLAEYADDPIVIRAIQSKERSEEEEPDATARFESALSPQPIWGSGNSLEREPEKDELVVRLVLLSGELAIFLDDGDRIRCLDPNQPKGERVNFTDVSAVGIGTYLLLREGQTERRFLYEEALKLMGSKGPDVEASQYRWKSLLHERLIHSGSSHVENELQILGVRTIDRVRAWTETTLVRPQNLRDFEILLNWLEVPVESTLTLANELRRKRSRASADIRERLEDAVDESDLTQMEVTGYLKMDLGIDGVRGMIAARVLAISPNSDIISRAEARIPFPSSRSKWLE